MTTLTIYCDINLCVGDKKLKWTNENCFLYNKIENR